MRRAAVVLGLVALAVGGAVGGQAAAAGAGEKATTSAAAPLAVEVELDRSKVSVGPGAKVVFDSVVTNTGDTALSDLVAHMSIFSTDSDVYVDPEDWSPRRTQYIDELTPGDDTRLTWDVRAVTAGPLVLYVGVTQQGTDAVSASGPLEMTVGGQREVNAANALPLVVGIPAAVALLLALVGVRRRRQR